MAEIGVQIDMKQYPTDSLGSDTSPSTGILPTHIDIDRLHSQKVLLAPPAKLLFGGYYMSIIQILATTCLIPACFSLPFLSPLPHEACSMRSWYTCPRMRNFFPSNITFIKSTP